MAKPPDPGQDSTQELTIDQLVPPARKAPAPEPTMPLSVDQILASPPKPPAQKTSKNDASTWGGLVVGADDFAPRAAQRRPRVPRWGIVALVCAAGAVVVGVVLSWGTNEKVEPSRGAAVAEPVGSSGSATGAPNKDTPRTPAVVATAPVAPAKTTPASDPKVAAAPGPQVESAAMGAVDAISSAAPPTKKVARKGGATKQPPKRGH